MSAVGAVTLRRLLHSSLTCLRCTPIASAKAPCVRPIGSMNSSIRISPTLAGLRFVVSMGHLTYWDVGRAKREARARHFPFLVRRARRFAPLPAVHPAAPAAGQTDNA